MRGKFHGRKFGEVKFAAVATKSCTTVHKVFSVSGGGIS